MCYLLMYTPYWSDALYLLLGHYHTTCTTVQLLLPSRARITHSVYRWATGWTSRILGFDSRRGLRICLFTAVSRTVLGPIQPPIQCVPRVLSLGVKRLRHEADHSPPYSSDIKVCVELCLRSPNTPSWRGTQLKTHRDNFTLLYLHHHNQLYVLDPVGPL